MFLYALTILSATLASAKDSAKPGQMHLAVGGPNEFVAAWYTKDEKASSMCLYGLSPNELSMASSDGTSITYLENWGTHHRARMTDLIPDSTYYYQCGDADKGMSEVFSFKSLPKDGNTAPLRFGILGDMGWLDSVQRPMRKLGDITMESNWSAVYSRNLMEQWKNDGEVDMFYHVGDVGYADDATFHSIATAVQFEYEDAYNGYMDWIENVTATMPYHVCPGNHESECHDPRCVVQFKKYGRPLSNFTAYNSRWVMPSESSGGVQSMWFSWDHGPVHFTSIDTSTDFEGAPEGEKGDSGIFAAGHFAPDGVYLAWVEADLKKASEDPNVEWIIAGGHRPLHTDDGWGKDMNDLFVKYGVSMYFAGHSHSYSRYDAEDHEGIIHVTVGGAGCEEMRFSDTNPTPGMHVGTTCSEWVANGPKTDSGVSKNKLESCASATFFTDAYAIGKLTIEDGGHGDLKWELMSSMDGSVIDSVGISKN